MVIIINKIDINKIIAQKGIKKAHHEGAWCAGQCP